MKQRNIKAGVLVKHKYSGEVREVLSRNYNEVILKTPESFVAVEWDYFNEAWEPIAAN